MKKLHLIFVVGTIICATASLFGQASSIFEQVEYGNDSKAKIRIVQDENLKKVVDKHQYLHGKAKQMIGYRIRIFSDSGPYAKNEFEYAKASFSENFGEITMHQEFVYPFYKIYVGDFRNRSQALFVLKQIERKFPDAFIVQTRINYPNLKKE